MTRIATGLVVALGLAAGIAAAQQDRPRTSDLVERATGRLAQLDVTVSGPEALIGGLTRDDFEVWIAGEFIDDFIVDRVCDEPAEGAELRADAPSEPQPPAAAPAAPVRSPATYLFYFDQQHLTMIGRNRSYQLASELIPDLVRDGNRALIVSNAKAFRIYDRWSDDPEAVLASLDEMHDDRTQWDPFSIEEEHHLQELADMIRKGDVQDAKLRAGRYRAEERWRTEKALRRFEMVLGRLADIPPPKAVVYFADTMRPNAGEHYARLFPQHANDNDDPFTNASSHGGFTGLLAFDAAIDQAAALGVRLYTIQAEGLVAPSAMNPASSQGRVNDAQNGLSGLALETGGEAFLNGISARKISRKIRRDMSCLYLVSFDPAPFAQDAPLSVRVQAKPAEIQTHVRGRIVLQSESARLKSRLLSAFGAGSGVDGGGEIHGTLIPTGFEDGRFLALLQVRVPGVPLPGTTWDVGASVQVGDSVPVETSKRVSVSRAGVAVVVETEARFKPGPYSVVAVAHESRTDQVVSRESAGEWPSPNRAQATVLGLTVLQPGAGVFVRGEGLRRSGSVAVRAGEAVRTDRPAAFVGMVCWERGRRKALRVERRLSGDSTADFPTMKIKPDGDRCATFRDLVEPNTMTDGGFVYEVVVFAGDVELTRGQRGFFAEAPAAALVDQPTM